MSDIRLIVGSVLLTTVLLLLAGSGCVPPIAWHDGLPAWTPAPNDVEWRLGYQHLSAFDADTFSLFGEEYARPDFGISYLTPGVRVGLGHGPLVADVGVASILSVGGSLGILAGPTFGVGRCDSNFSVMFRPSLYLLGMSIGGEESGLQWAPWYQLELLLGNGYRSKGVSFALGGRAGLLAVGPVGVADVILHPVDLRAEVSYMLPASPFATGSALTIGLTVAAPARRGPLPKEERE
jgi:hypothetical protein